jgi:hypothetical protein
MLDVLPITGIYTVVVLNVKLFVIKEEKWKQSIYFLLLNKILNRYNRTN